MSTRLPATALFLSVLMAAGSATALDLPRPSPAASVSQRVGLTDIQVEYSSPGVKGRKIWGGLVPYDELWRTGANASTKITFSRDVRVAGTDVAAGTYSLLTIPSRKKWTLILNTDASLAGTRGYDEKKDAMRASLSTRSASRRERMTFLFANTTDDATDLVLEWDKLALVVPIAADTDAQVMENIEAGVKSSAGDLAGAARYLLHAGKDPERALELADNAARIEPGWMNTWVLARAQAANGSYDDAIASAKKAHELGMKAEYFFWKDDVEKALRDWPKKAR